MVCIWICHKLRLFRFPSALFIPSFRFIYVNVASKYHKRCCCEVNTWNSCKHSWIFELGNGKSLRSSVFRTRPISGKRLDAKKNIEKSNSYLFPAAHVKFIDFEMGSTQKFFTVKNIYNYSIWYYRLVNIFTFISFVSDPVHLYEESRSITMHNYIKFCLMKRSELRQIIIENNQIYVCLSSSVLLLSEELLLSLLNCCCWMHKEL